MGDLRPRGRTLWSKEMYLWNNECQWPYNCYIMDCMERADGGGHVHVEGQRRNAVYIVPMCDRTHNTAKNKEWLPVKQGTKAMLIKVIDENAWCVIV